MMNWLKFWWGCLRWAFTRWETGEPILTPIILFTYGFVFALMGLGSIYQAIQQSNLLWLFAWLPFVILTIALAPYQLWKQNEIKIRDLTTTRLWLEPQRGKPDKDQKIWYFLKVSNTSALSVKGCYGQLAAFQILSKINDQYQPPTNSVRYAWTGERGGSDCRISALGPNSWDILDIICVDGTKNVFYTPILARDNWTRNLSYPLPPGEYEAEIQVSSEEGDSPSTKIRISIIYNGGIDLDIKDITKQNAKSAIVK